MGCTSRQKRAAVVRRRTTRMSAVVTTMAGETVCGVPSWVGVGMIRVEYAPVTLLVMLLMILMVFCRCESTYTNTYSSFQYFTVYEIKYIHAAMGAGRAGETIPQPLV